MTSASFATRKHNISAVLYMALPSLTTLQAGVAQTAYGHHHMPVAASESRLPLSHMCPSAVKICYAST